MGPYHVITVSLQDHQKRLDSFLSEELAAISRSQLKRWIEEGYVCRLDPQITSEEQLAIFVEKWNKELLKKKLVYQRNPQHKKAKNDLRPREAVVVGERFLLITPPEEPLAKGFPEEISLDILYEDEEQLLVNKPAGMVVHAGHRQEKGTLVNALLYHQKELSEGSEVHRPGIVHRLDKETSGCILVAKNNWAHARLAAQFAERTVQKTYLALVQVKSHLLRERGKIDLFLGRHPHQRLKMAPRNPPSGKNALTEYQVLERKGSYALVLCYPRTGRMHQIRVHLSQLGAPILGDPLYGERGNWNRHLLHAWRLKWQHPSTGAWIVGEAPLPQEFSLDTL